MTAYPEKADLEHVIRQMGPPGNGRPVRKQAAPEIATRPWRVVAADGTANPLDLPASGQSAKRIRDQPEPAGRRFCRLPSSVASLFELAAGPTGGSIAMPSADSRLPHDFVANSEGDRPCGDQPNRAISAPKRGAVRLTETGVCLPPPVLPRQSSSRCPDIDSGLTRVIGAWPMLPQGIKVAILAMIEATREDG